MLDLNEYREVITYSEDPAEALGTDELILLMAELIDDDKISEVAGKYVDDFDKSWNIIHDEITRLQIDNSAYRSLISSIKNIIDNSNTPIEDIKEKLWSY